MFSLSIYGRFRHSAEFRPNRLRLNLSSSSSSAVHLWWWWWGPLAQRESISSMPKGAHGVVDKERGTCCHRDGPVVVGSVIGFQAFQDSRTAGCACAGVVKFRNLAAFSRAYNWRMILIIGLSADFFSPSSRVVLIGPAKVSDRWNKLVGLFKVVWWIAWKVKKIYRCFQGHRLMHNNEIVFFLWSPKSSINAIVLLFSRG